MYVPGIDKYTSPFYQIFFVLQIIITPMGCCMYIPFTNLIVAFILFAILMCNVLQHKLKNLKDCDNFKAREVIVWCIKYQLKLVKWDKKIIFVFVSYFPYPTSSPFFLCCLLNHSS